MKLIENASKWYRMFSIWALGVIAAIQIVVIALPMTTLAARVPMLGDFTWADLNATLTVATAVFGAIGRLIKQGPELHE